MNFIREIAGKDGELLSSAVLRFLMLRSQEIREGIIRLISDKSNIGAMVLDSSFSCYLESPTEDQRGRGRLDLMIEIDDAVIGIENKLNAGFQENQPGKYLKHLEEKAGELAIIRKSKPKHILAILAPEIRKKEVEERLGDDHEHYVFITWQEVFKLLKDTAANLDPTTHAITESFREYVSDEIEFAPKFKDFYAHFHKPFRPKGSDEQKSLVWALKQFFPDPGSMGAGPTWVGYYIAGYNAWCGFLSQAELKGSDLRGSELIVATRFEVSFSPESFRQVSLKNERFLAGSKAEHVWVINFTRDWSSPQKWRAELRPLLDAWQTVLSSQAKT